MDVPIAANVLGTLGAVCWSIQLIPQIIINYRRHDTTGLQPTMMLLWASAGIPLGVYNIVQSFNIALRIQPQILTFLSLVTWAQFVPLGLVMGAIEAGLVIGLRQAISRHIQWPSMLMAILSAVLLSAGVLRHYWDIYKERTVRGISFLFVGIDALGDLTSLISIFFQPHLDVLGMVIYGSELILWLGVFACGGWFNLRPRVKQMLHDKRLNRSQAGERCNHQESSTEPVNHEFEIEDVQSISPNPSTVFRTASGQSSEQEVRLRNLAHV